MDAAGSAYRTLSRECGPVVFKARGSKFLGYAFPADSRDDAKSALDRLWELYPDATHICYAFRIGLNPPDIRINDDGEPAHSAGDPIFGQIESYGLYGVLIAVVRYFGGTKLGVGGLIQAYREAARLCLDDAVIVTKEPMAGVCLRFSYDSLDGVMRLIDQKQLQVDRRQMELTCRIDLSVPVRELDSVLENLRALPGVDVEVLPGEAGRLT